MIPPDDEHVKVRLDYCRAAGLAAKNVRLMPRPRQRLEQFLLQAPDWHAPQWEEA
jgi:hypothetical protein